jgi:hypothetical protein
MGRKTRNERKKAARVEKGRERVENFRGGTTSCANGRKFSLEREHFTKTEENFRARDDILRQRKRIFPGARTFYENGRKFPRAGRLLRQTEENFRWKRQHFSKTEQIFGRREGHFAGAEENSSRSVDILRERKRILAGASTFSTHGGKVSTRATRFSLTSLFPAPGLFHRSPFFLPARVLLPLSCPE